MVPHDLFSFFVCNIENGVFPPRKIVTILRNIAMNSRQASVKGALLSVSVLECLGKIF